MNELLLVRHGESVWNRLGRIQGRTDSPLTPAGLTQAEAIGYLLGDSIDPRNLRIYVSPLIRARQTADVIVRVLGLQSEAVRVDERLNDFDLGEITGSRGWDRVADHHPEQARLRLEDPMRFHPPGGESGAQFAARLQSFLDDLDEDGTALVISHGVVNKFIRSLRRNLSGADIIALGESQESVYRLIGVEESEIRVGDDARNRCARSVTVELGERTYDIVVGAGLLEQAGDYLEHIIEGRRVAVVCDDFVAARYLPRIQQSLDRVAQSWQHFLIEDGEQAKSFGGLEKLLDAMLAAGIDRDCVVLALGGGVVGDVGGFAAALLMRGVMFVQVPTTLMSQVDSAVGGKNAINTRQGKNLVGTFLQPRIVLNDVSVLRTLPAHELRAGYGEIIKYGLLRGETEFSWLERNHEAILSGDEAALVEVVSMGCRTKADIVSEDELDQGKRALVNLGHTFAHAFETCVGYGHVPHGAAVAVGLVAACEMSERGGFCATGISQRVRKHTRAVGLPSNLNELSANGAWSCEEIKQSMLHDKKTVSGNINFVLLRAMGEPFVTADVSPRCLDDTLTAVGAR